MALIRRLVVAAILAGHCGCEFLLSGSKDSPDGGGCDSCGPGQTCDSSGSCACKEGEVLCGSLCLAPGGSCADACAKCTAPAHARPVCSAGSCDFVCEPLAYRCGAGCCVGTGLAVGEEHSCAIAANGTVKCWGINDWDQSGPVGDKVTSPGPVSGLSDVVQVAAGGPHSCALTGAGAVLCWGGRPSGQLGDGLTGGWTSTPKQIVDVTAKVVAISAGAVQTCALTEAGTLYCWGPNGDGALGDGSTTWHSRPTAVVDLAQVSGMACGGNAAHDFTCAWTSNDLYCFGSNLSGQLGQGATDKNAHSRPVKVSGIAGKVVAASAGSRHICALTDAGAVYCWGANDVGQVGDGTTTDPRPAPVRVIESGVIAVSAGLESTCALMSSGAVQCWGSNDRGRLGDGTDVPSTQPKATLVNAGATAIGVAAGLVGAHACARMEDGTIRCWGANSQGQLGDTTTSDRWEPAPVRWP